MDIGISDFHGRLRNVLEAPPFSPARRYLMWREALAEDRFVKKIGYTCGVRTFNFDRMKGRLTGKGQKVFYVLGSGSSIEELTSKNFEAISGEVSVGINAWALHDFVPDIYAFEPVPERDSDHYSTMKLLGREDVLRRKPTIMFLKPRNPIEGEQLRMIPRPLLDGTFLYGRFQPYTRRVENLAEDLKLMPEVALKNLSVVPDSGASIVRMAWLGLLLGYPRVVFAGVDLNHTQYFWEKNPSYLKKFGRGSFESGQQSSTHETLRSSTRAFGVLDMLSELAKFATHRGAQMEVVSRKSMLADFLPIHDWKSRLA